MDIEGVALTVGVDRHGARASGGAEDLLGQAVEVPGTGRSASTSFGPPSSVQSKNCWPQALPRCALGASVMITTTALICKINSDNDIWATRQW